MSQDLAQLEAKLDSLLALLEQPAVPLADQMPSLWADQMQLAVALRAVVRNALEAFDQMPHESTGTLASEKKIRIEASCAAPGQFTIQVADTGPGLDARGREHLFDPFFSGREAGRGIGFGLCKAWRIVTEHGGTITVTENAPRGTHVTIILPLGAGNLC